MDALIVRILSFPCCHSDCPGSERPCCPAAFVLRGGVLQPALFGAFCPPVYFRSGLPLRYAQDVEHEIIELINLFKKY